MISLLRFIKKLDTVRSLQLFQIFRFAGFFLTGILLAKGPLSITNIGVFESLMFFSGAVSFFWISGILNGLLSKFSRVNSENQGKFIFNISMFIIIMNILLVIVLFFARDFANLFLSSVAMKYYTLLLTFILFNNPVFLIEYVLLIKEQNISLIVYGFVNFVLQIIVVVVPILLGYDLSISIKGLVLLSISKLFFLGFLLNKFTDKKTDLSIWKEHFHYSMPLILSLLLSGSADYIDGALVSSHFGSESFAIFRYGAKELPLSLLLANSLSLAFVPKLADKSQFEYGLTQLKKESLKLMHLLFPLSIILLLSSHWLYPYFFRAEFIKSSSIFNIYLILIISRMVFPQTIILALQKTGIIFKIAIIEITVNVIASYLLMLKFGMLGVAWGTIIAFSAEKIFLMIVLYKKQNLPVTKYLAIKEWVLYSLLLIFCYFLVENFII